MSEKVRLIWEKIIDEENELIFEGLTKRAEIPGGWIVITQRGNTAMTFVPDPNHEWK